MSTQTVVSAPTANGRPVPAAKDIAEKMIKMGSHVIFFPRGQKAIKDKDWPNKATLDLAIVEEKTKSMPYANVGVVGKPDGNWFFDDDGSILAEYETLYGTIHTYRARSVSGGTHLYFKQNDLSRAMGNISGVDFDGSETWSARVINRYVVAAGSSAHPDNDPSKPEVFYEAVDNIPVVEAPASFIKFLKSKADKKTAPVTPLQTDMKISHGGIHGFMLSEAGKMRHLGMNQHEIEAVLLRRVHEECEAPIDDNKVRQMAKSICTYPPGEDKRLVLSSAPVLKASSDTLSVEEDGADPIPPFDPSVVNGIYKKFVDVATNGTTMTPQFVYAIAKTVVGARMAGKVKFENLDVEPRFYAALIGETGSGKGEAWRRVFQVLNVENQIRNVSGLKIINSADSGAGIRDAFFEPPEELPMLMYIDEVESFGNKATATRNPAILDTLIELADSTYISRVKAKSSKAKATKTKNDARLCAVMCGQDGLIYMKAFAGRTKLGLWDRLYPEYAVAVEAGDLPPISTADAYQLLCELNSLDFSGTMTMHSDAKARLDAFWSSQPTDVRKKARWKKNLTLDAYMSAFGRGLKQVGSEDVDVATKIFIRQLVIRQVCFTTEVPDRIGYYLGLLKAITEKMEQRLLAGAPADQVAKSRRDYERETHAHRDNEGHIFDRAWAVYVHTWLSKVEVRKDNGQSYLKYLPVVEDD